MRKQTETILGCKYPCRIEGETAYISINHKGNIHEIIMDTEDISLFSKVNGSIYIRSGSGRPMIWVDRKRGIRVDLHRLILGVSTRFQVDHLDHNLLDCRKKKLRPANTYQNSWNKRKIKKETKSKYKGVFATNRKKNPWYSCTRKKGKRYYLGRFKTEEAAAKAYDDFWREHGEGFAIPNIQIKTN